MSSSIAARPWTWAVGLMALYVIGVLPSLGQSLLESHAFRQTQTAYTAVLYAERGIDLLRPPLPILGPPGIIPLEFPLFQAAGAVLMAIGLDADFAMRLSGLATFLGAATAVFALARRLVSPSAALVALAAFLYNAHAWVYGRTSLIEYLAAGSGLAFLYFALRWADDSRATHWALALIFGAVATSVKITTGGFYLIPALLIRDARGRWGFQSGATLALVGVAAMVGLAWSAYAQSVRAETPAAAFLALQSQPAWLFGTIDQRLDPGQWRLPLVVALMLTGSGIVAWAPMAVLQARLIAQKPFALALLSLPLAVPLILFNLYVVHDYYFAAVAPLVAVGIGLGADWLITHRTRRWAKRATVAFAGAWVATAIGLFGSWSIIYGTPPEEEQALRVSSFIAEHSDPDDWVVLRGLGWNPTFLYYARRQGIAVPDHGGFQDTSTIDLGAILADPRMGPEMDCDLGGNCAVTKP